MELTTHSAYYHVHRGQGESMVPVEIWLEPLGHHKIVSEHLSSYSYSRTHV